MEPKRRKQNWNPAALGVLIVGVEKNYGILKGKLSSSLTRSSKDGVWENICTKVNSVSSENRSIEDIKKKWSDYSSGLKKKEGARRREMTGGGDAPPDLTDMEQKVINIIGDVAIDGVIGGIDTMDYTCTPNTKKSAKVSANEELLSIERERLLTEKERLLIEKENMKINKERLEVEKERLNLAKRKYSVRSHYTFDDEIEMFPMV
ncbi:nuclear apoptosis-inducing factor 1-like [Patella vulgata]|uniref:nuclear apoptosis-inducing factor 1-like n=1 Tax=Patella vulgata TaxID=6465 RepID=UPI0024A81AD1|nr:nuclear apoptosis-inducing factor 1-like [Patella vulgata]